MPEANASATEAASTATATAPAPAEGAHADKVQSFLRQSGLTVDQMLQAAQQTVYTSTPEGAAKLLDLIEETNGPEIARKMLATKPDAVLDGLDREVRRKVRRAVDRRDGRPATDTTAASPQDEAQDDPAPGPAEEAREAAERRAEERMRQQDAKLEAVATAVRIAPQLLALASKTPQAAAHFEEWQAGVVARLETKHPRYQGADGLVHASEDVLNGWKRMGEMAGLQPAAAPTPRPGSEITLPDPGDINKGVADAYRKGRSTGIVDHLMETLFQG